jgi:hypothetical protein
MRRSQILVLLLTLTSRLAFSQPAEQKALVDVIHTTFRLGKLPKILLQKPDSIFRYEIPTDYIAIQATLGNKLERYHPVTFEGVRIEVWEGEDIFLHNTQSFLTPEKITLKNGRFTLEYRTKRFSRNELPCYKGTIVAQELNDGWKIRKSTFKECECQNWIDTF